MKKTYIQPLTEVVRINAEQMICESQQFSLSSESKYNGTTTIESKDDYDYDDNLW